MATCRQARHPSRIKVKCFATVVKSASSGVGAIEKNSLVTVYFSSKFVKSVGDMFEAAAEPNDPRPCSDLKQNEAGNPDILGWNQCNIWNSGLIIGYNLKRPCLLISAITHDIYLHGENKVKTPTMLGRV